MHSSPALTAPIRFIPGGFPVWAALALASALIASPAIAQGMMWANNAWSSSGGKDPNHGGNRAFTFRADAGGPIQIDLISVPSADAYMYLQKADGTPVAENDDAGGNRNPQITATLSANTFYKVIAATFSAGQAAEFRLSMNRPTGSGVTLSLNVAPSFSKQPASVSVPEGRTVNFTVYTTLISKIDWRRNGVSVFPGSEETNAFNLLAAKPSEAGGYSAVISAGSQSATSSTATLTVTAKIFSQNTWKQPRFYIGAWWDPAMTGTASADEKAYSDFYNAGFNLATGYQDNHFTAPWNTFNGGTLSNSYRLERVSKVPGLSLFVNDSRVIGVNVASVPSATIQAMTNEYKSLPSASRAVMAGYHLGDEPWFLNRNGGQWDSGAAANLKKLESVSDADRARPSWMNLRSNWGFTTWPEYEEYVNGMARNAESKIISYDYYPLNEGSCCTGTNGYFPLLGGVPIYRHHQLFANAVKNIRLTQGRDIYYWGFPSATEEVYGIPTNFRHLVLPDDSQLRFQAWSDIIYGAKGIIWYTYAKPKPDTNFLVSPTTNSVLMANLKKLNGEIRLMGNFLMGLDWITTMHGQPTDSRSTETGLPTPSSEHLLISPEYGIPEYYAIGIHRDRVSKKHILMVMNKRITLPTVPHTTTSSTTNTIAVLGWGSIQKFNKSTGAWEYLPVTLAQSAMRVSLSSHKPGDMEMLRVNRVSIANTVYRNLLWN